MKHTGPHKYQTVQLKSWDSKAKVLKCMLPDCPHYLTHPRLGIGRLTLCHWCGSVFQLDNNSYRKVKPKCADCVKKNGEIRRSLKEAAANL